jgi:hypothetical protein
LISLGGFSEDGDIASWSVTNNGSSSVFITRIVLDWPASKGALDRIRFNNSSIWNGNDDSPPTIIDSGWTGTGGRELLGGESKDLKFEFTSNAQGSGYSLQLTVDDSCLQSAGD